MRTILPVAAVLLAANLAGAHGQTGAQQPAPPPSPPSEPSAPGQPVFRAGIDLIEIDVSVVDSRGRPITDLLGPEFNVTIDGQPRKVVSAQFTMLRPSRDEIRRAAEPAPDRLFSSNAGAARGRLILIAVDRENISFGAGRHTMRAAARFLDTVGPADRVGLITIPGGGPSIDFTANHASVRKAIERLGGLAHRPKILLNMGVVEAYAVAQKTDPRLEAAVLQRFCGHLPQGSTAEQVCELDVRSEGAAIVGQVRMQVETSVHTLRSVLEALREIEGPKSLVWISEGLPLEGMGSELSDIGRLAADARTTIHVVLLDAPLVDMAEAELPPTQREDREMQVRGLEAIAGYSRGALLRVSANPDAVFQRLDDELSGHYLLGVESTVKDTDGKRHPIAVSVRRSGAQVRARREFVMAGPQKTAAEPIETRLQRLLRSPFAATDLPLRLATYAYRDPNSPKVRILVATEIGGATDSEPGEVALAFALVDREGNVAMAGTDRRKIAPSEGRAAVVEHVGALSVEPGSYTLRLAAIDAAGRRGSIDHPLHAWEMSNVPFAFGDLIVADPPAPNESLRPVVEARVTSGRLAAYLELYADTPAALDDVRVRVEVAADESGPALASGDGTMSSVGDPRSRTVSTLVPVTALPPGHYMARAIVTRGGQKAGELTRSFVIDAESGSPAAARPAAIPGRAPLAEMLAAPSQFRREDLLEPEVVGVFLDLLEKKNPGIRNVTAQVRKGSFAGAARLAFEAGDQVASMFVRGLELLAAGDPNKAAAQFDGAIRITPDFTPAAFYLGACYAAGGRDREAVTWWRRALGAPAKTPVQYAALGDALVRLGDLDQAVATMVDALAAWPEDDDLRRRLALAQARALKHADALATIEPYLAKHPDDQELLLVGLHTVYAMHVDGKTATEQDRERMKAWATAYTAAKGPHAAAVTAWVAFVTSGK